MKSLFMSPRRCSFSLKQVLVLLGIIWINECRNNLSFAAAAATPSSSSSSSSSSEAMSQSRHRREKCGLHVPSYIVPQHLMIAHRGASFHLPEHTLAAYRLALELGADYIEPDLVVTKDLQLVAMHALDLSITTNVAHVFPASRQTFSKWANQTSYWVYDFTLTELQTLKVKQRLPQYRSTQFDNFFGIPTLKEIFHLVDDWNINVAPNLSWNMSFASSVIPMSSRGKSKASGSTSSNSGNPISVGVKRRRAGVYAELKDADWILQEKGIDVVQVFLDTLESILPPNATTTSSSTTNTTSTNTTSTSTNSTATPSSSSLSPSSNSSLIALWDDKECQSLKYDEYIIPLLVVQSFEGHVLSKLHDEWKHRYDNTTLVIPPPPMVLLLDKMDCTQDNVWFKIGDAWRSFIKGIGPHKDCLLPTTSSNGENNPSNNNNNNNNNHTTNKMMPINNNNNHDWEDLVDLAIEHDLVLHPWTERPEMEFLSDLPMSTTTSSYLNNTVWQELQTLFCHRPSVHGIFTEHLHLTIMATWWFSSGGCDSSTISPSTSTTTTTTTTTTSPRGFPNDNKNSNDNSNNNDNNNNATNSAAKRICYETDREANLYIGVAAFIMGAFISAMGTLWFVGQGRQLRRLRTTSARRGTRVPSDDLELEMI